MHQKCIRISGEKANHKYSVIYCHDERCVGKSRANTHYTSVNVVKRMVFNIKCIVIRRNKYSLC